jgi:hypothetical protein
LEIAGGRGILLMYAPVLNITALSSAATKFANNLVIAVARGIGNITDLKSATVRLFHDVDAGGLISGKD